MAYRIELLRQNPYLLADYRKRSHIAISNLQNIISNPQEILSMSNIMEKYLHISERIGLDKDGVSCYGYFVPLNANEYFLLRLSNHNNTNGLLYDEHEKEGRPNKRFIIYFIGNNYKKKPPINFREAEHHVINYPVTSLDTEKGVISFCTQLIQLFNKGFSEFAPLQSAYNVGQFYNNGKIKGIIAQTDNNGQATLLIDCQNIKDKAIANRKILKQYGKYLYPSIRLNAFNSPSWRLPTVSEGKELLNNFNKINQNIQNIGGKIEIIPNVIWAQDNSYIDFEHNQIGVSQDNDDCFAIRRVMNIDTNLIENKQYNKNTNMKQTIRLTESELRKMITESVRKIIKEAIVPKACAYCGNPIKQGDNYCSKCGANIQEMVNKHNAWLQQNPNVNNEPMVWGQQSQQQSMQQSQQPMQQQQRPPQQRQQPTSTNNNTMINNQVQQQMQRNMGMQQKMANKIRQQKMAKFN